MEDKIFNIVTDLVRGDISKYEAIDKLLILHSVSQRSELLGCPHNQVRIDSKDVGACVKCGVKMEKAWQPNCG